MISSPPNVMLLHRLWSALTIQHYNFVLNESKYYYIIKDVKSIKYFVFSLFWGLKQIVSSQFITTNALKQRNVPLCYGMGRLLVLSTVRFSMEPLFYITTDTISSVLLKYVDIFKQKLLVSFYYLNKYYINSSIKDLFLLFNFYK